MRELIDLDRYPIDQPGSTGWLSMVANARADLACHGMFNLEGFMHPAALSADVARLAPRFDTEAFTHARRHNIYFHKEVPGLVADHPALAQAETISRTLCADQMANTAVARLYEYAPFAAFLAATMDKPALYTMEDPLARLNEIGRAHV